jgi:hypothetical protein
MDNIVQTLKYLEISFSFFSHKLIVVKLFKAVQIASLKTNKRKNIGNAICNPATAFSQINPAKYISTTL